jgi:protein-disulfide isomerase
MTSDHDVGSGGASLVTLDERSSTAVAAIHCAAANPGPRPPRSTSPGFLLRFGAIGVVAIAVIAAALVGGDRTHTTVSSPAPAPIAPSAASGPNGSYTLGAGPTMVEEYADYQCPQCAQWFRTVEPAVRRLAAAGQITFAFHNLADLGTESTDEANAAICAGQVGKFWQMHDFLFAHQQTENSGFWTTDELLAALATIGADTPGTAQCVKADTYRPWIEQQDVPKGGIASGPTIIVNGTTLRDVSLAKLLNSLKTPKGTH